jgi:8-oxo-dGTP pyrophosphatase MutT (NUDIX family)
MFGPTLILPNQKSNQIYKKHAVNTVLHSAFNSLSFKGSRGYSNNTSFKVKQQPPKPPQQQQDKQPVYGGILILQKDNTPPKYALVQGRYTGKWSFPKGHANEDESPLNCTKREILEETGIETLPQPEAYIEIGFGNYYVFYFKEEVQLQPRDENEIINSRWVTLEEMERMPLNADASNYRKQLISSRNEIIRNQQLN